MAVSISSANPILINPQALLRLPDVLALFPVSRSAWWEGIAEGKFPKPIKLGGPRSVAWRASEILELIDRLSNAPRTTAWVPPKKKRRALENGKTTTPPSAPPPIPGSRST